MTADMVQFLRDRLDEDEQVARGHGQWSASWHQDDFVSEVRDDENAGTVAHVPNLGDLTHIARHDPARVLAEVDAKRRMLTVHKRDTTYSFSGCITCDAGDNSCGCMGGSAYEYQCETLRVIALPYASHPDYRTKWAPDPA